MQLLKQGHFRLQFVRTEVLQIASKDYHVRLLVIDGINNLLPHILFDIIVSGNMRIRELHDAITVESLGKVLAGKFYLLHMHIRETNRHAIDCQTDNGTGQCYANSTTITTVHQLTTQKIGKEGYNDETHHYEKHYSVSCNHISIN